MILFFGILQKNKSVPGLWSEDFRFWKEDKKRSWVCSWRKIIKKSEELAFSNKAKFVNINVSAKVKTYIQQNLSKELGHFKNKYKLELNIISDNNLIIPEYKIELLNKNKKIINKIENIESVEKISRNNNYNRKNFINKKNNKNFKTAGKFKKKFKHYSKIKKNNFVNR